MHQNMLLCLALSTALCSCELSEGDTKSSSSASPLPSSSSLSSSSTGSSQIQILAYSLRNSSTLPTSTGLQKLDSAILGQIFPKLSHNQLKSGCNYWVLRNFASENLSHRSLSFDSSTAQINLFQLQPDSSLACHYGLTTGMHFFLIEDCSMQIKESTPINFTSATDSKLRCTDLLPPNLDSLYMAP